MTLTSPGPATGAGATAPGGGPFERAYRSVATALLGSGVAHLVLTVLLGAAWSGPVSLRKAATFGLSFGVLLVVVGSMARRFGHGGPVLRRWLLGVLALAAAGETLAATVLAWRRVLANAVPADPIDVALGRSGAVTSALLVIAVVGLAVTALRPARSAAPTVQVALWSGHLAAALGTVTGVMMIVRGAAAEAVPGPTLASVPGPSLLPAHLIALTGIVILPGLAAWGRPRLAVIVLASAGHLLLAGAVTAAALAGVDPLGPIGVLAGIGAAALLLAVTITAAPRAKTARHPHSISSVWS